MTKQSYTLLALCMLLGTPAWILVHYQVAYVSPEFSVGLRFLVAFCVLECVRITRKEPRVSLSFSDKVLVAVQGIFLYSINFWLCYESTHYMASGLVAATVSTMIIPNMILGAVILKTPIKLESVMGATLGLAGVLLLFKDDLMNLQQGLGALQGFLLAFASTFFSVIGTITAGKVIKRKIPLYYATSRAMLIGGLFSIFIAFMIDGQLVIPLNFEFIGSLLYLGIAVTTLVYLLYSKLVGEVGAGNASFLWIVMPAVCLAVSAAFEGYAWTLYSTIGVLMIVLGGLFSTVGSMLLVKLNMKKLNIKEV